MLHAKRMKNTNFLFILSHEPDDLSNRRELVPCKEPPPVVFSQLCTQRLHHSAASQTTDARALLKWVLSHNAEQEACCEQVASACTSGTVHNVMHT
jgi:hypothetical protein